MKTRGRVNVYILIVLTSAIGGGEWPALRPGRFTATEWETGMA
jgi:hypothetical protein